MFLKKLKENNEKLLHYAFDLHQSGEILPDTYVLDLDAIKENASLMVEKANELNIELYYMLKQIGRNPYIGKMLENVGFKGCVAVDYKEALTLIDGGCHMSNVGHLVQVPKFALKKILMAKPDYLTIYSLDIVDEISKLCIENNLNQKVLIRITDDDAQLYSGQVAGFSSNILKDVLAYIENKAGVEFGGITVFPALLYNPYKKAIEPTDNINGLERAKTILKLLGYKDYMINVPSASCCASFKTARKIAGDKKCSCEPGHGLTGTTPLHKDSNEPEKVAYCYVSEVCHNFKDKAYCYGGGHYRRGHMKNCLVGSDYENMKLVKVVAPDDDSIDYHYELSENFKVGETCLMCYRTQIFTTRSTVALVEGISNNNPKLIGLYNSQGEKVDRNW